MSGRVAASSWSCSTSSRDIAVEYGPTTCAAQPIKVNPTTSRMSSRMARTESLRRRLGCVEISARQVRGFPVHSHLDPGAAAWMIVENKFFERRRIELAIRAELERDARFAVGLARSVDPELVRFAFGGAHNRIENGRYQKGERHEDQ